jgi:hypothetical protein
MPAKRQKRAFSSTSLRSSLCLAHGNLFCSSLGRGSLGNLYAEDSIAELRIDFVAIRIWR